jgi:hypothetical protein
MDRLFIHKVGPVAVLLITAVLGGCGPGDDKGKTEKQAEAPPPPKAAPAPAPAPAPKKEAPKAEGPGPGWTLLGQQQVGLKTEKERIAIGVKEGQFRELLVMAKGAGVTIDSMTVTLGSKKEFKLKVQQELKEGESSKPIDLPGEARNIRHVDFVYRTAAKGSGRATVMLYGR